MIRNNEFYGNSNENKMLVDIFGMSENGHHRTTNEDAFIVSNVERGGKLLAVADGFSNSLSEEASHLAVGELLEKLVMPSGWNIRQRLQNAFDLINRKITDHFHKNQQASSVGTTLTAIYLHEGNAVLAHIGNTRAYLMRNGKIKQLTIDQTFAQLLLKSGIEPTAAARKTLLQALGIGNRIEPFFVQTEVRSGDYFLLCSDGFSNSVEESEIVQTVNENPDVSVAVERLVEMANERDGSDNITVVLARVTEEEKKSKMRLIVLEPLAVGTLG